jgi:hypothetical protein
MERAQPNLIMCLVDRHACAPRTPKRQSRRQQPAALCYKPGLSVFALVVHAVARRHLGRALGLSHRALLAHASPAGALYSVRVAPFDIARLSHIGRRLAVGVERWWGCIVSATRLVKASTGAGKSNIVLVLKSIAVSGAHMML